MARKHHALAVPLPAQGHMKPLMRFCKKLAAEGVMVTFVNIDPIHYLIEELTASAAQKAEVEKKQQQPAANGYTFSSAAGSVATREYPRQEQKADIKRAHVPIEGLDLSQSFALSLETFFEAQKSIVPHLERLLQQLNSDGGSPPVTFLISDVCMTAATQTLADAFNIPRIVLYPSSQSTHLFYHHLLTSSEVSIKGVLEIVSKQDRHPREVVIEGLEGLPALRAVDLPRFHHVVDDTPYMYTFMEQELRECFNKAYAIVLNSFEELEGAAFRALSARVKPPMYGVGPLVEEGPLEDGSSTSLWREDEACMLWLDQQPPLSVLYISFGSVTLLPYAQVQEIAAALLSIQQRFLWVVRPDLIQGAPPGHSPFHFISQTKGRGCIVDWAPQLRVLAHPSTGGFLSHCGWNSTIEAIYHGVPMLCWPYFADQYFDAKFVVEEWKTGLRFETNTTLNIVERSEIERVIKTLLEDEEGKILRINATRFKEASQQSILPQGTSYKNIQVLLESLP